VHWVGLLVPYHVHWSGFCIDVASTFQHLQQKFMEEAEVKVFFSPSFDMCKEEGKGGWLFSENFFFHS
jgi:hypothetical protein